MKLFWACLIAGLAVCAGAADSTKEGAETPRKNGDLLCELNVKSESSDWEKFENYEYRVVRAFEVMDKAPVMTLRNAARKKNDTAWLLLSREIPLPASAKQLTAEIDFRAALIWNVPNNPKTPFRNCVIWYDGNGKKLKSVDIAYKGIPEEFSLTRIPLEVPQGASSFRIQFGADNPNIVDQQYIAYRSVRVFSAE